MTLTRWDPFRESLQLSNVMDRLFENAFVQPSGYSTGGQRNFYLPMDVYTTDEEVVVHALLPGVEPEDVNISFEGNTLTIAGEITPPVEQADWIMQETGYGAFRRTLTLDIPVNADQADATFENGRLMLHLPKVEEAKAKRIQVHAK